MNRLLASMVRQDVLANVLMIVILLAGFYAGTSMVREAFPDVALDMITVTVAYPGANVEEVEEGVSRKVEEAIDGLEGIKRYTTISSEGVSRSIIEIKSGFSMVKARNLVENAVDAISTFPVDAEKPITTEVSRRREVLLLALWGDMDERTRKELAEQFKDELQALPGISQVSVSGVRDYEIVIEISEPRLREYGLTFSQVAQAFRRGSVNLSGGSLRTKGEQINIRAEGRKYTGEEIGSIVLLARPDGELITLDRIATIRDAFTEDSIIARFNGEPAVLISIFKTSDEDSIAIARAGHEFAANKQLTLPEGIHLTAWSDGSRVIDDRLRITFRNGMIGLSIVLLSLWFFLDTRLSFWVAMGIPISLAGSLIILWLSGLTLSSITLFGLVMVTGIVVDDAIVVGEAIYVHRKQGDGPIRAAVNGLTEVGLPVIAAVCTTMVAFLPLMFIQGLMGKFMYTMAIAVIGALAVSLVEALFILPAHLNHLPDPNAPPAKLNRFRRLGARWRKAITSGLDYVINRIYGPFVRRAVRYRYITLSTALAIVLVTVGFVMGGFVHFVFFPSTDENQIIATVEFPQGTPTEITEQAVLKTESALWDLVSDIKKDVGSDIVDYIYTVIGEGNSDNESQPAATGTHIGKIRVELVHSNIRGIHSQDLLARWEKRVGNITGTLSQSFSVGGSVGPGGAAIDIWVQGDDTDVLRAVAEDLKIKLRTYEGVYQIQDSFRPGKRELKLDIKPEARTLGLTLDDVARQVYAGFFGEEAARLQRGRDDIRVKVRYTDAERSTLAELEKVRIRTPEGHEVPFFSVAAIEFGAGPAVIQRANGIRRISVTAEIDETVANTVEIVADMSASLFPELYQKYSGMTMSFEGSQQQRSESTGSLFALFPVAMAGIFIIIATIFRSYVQPLIVMVTVPMGIIGAIYGHLLMGLPIVMFSIFGMMALTGVVVNDAIILIEAVNRQIARGVPIFEAIALGGIRRFRAIVLTTVSTVGALFPLIIETDLSSQPLKPMALSIASGVAFATVLTLIFIPCLLAVLSDLRLLTHYILHRRWPTREELEPARLRNSESL